MSCIHLGSRRRIHAGDQIIGLYAETLAPTHLDECTSLVLLAQRVAKLLRRARRKPHERIIQVRVTVGLALVTESAQRLLHLGLWIILPRVDHVVDRVRMPKARVGILSMHR